MGSTLVHAGKKSARNVPVFHVVVHRAVEQHPTTLTRNDGPGSAFREGGGGKSVPLGWYERAAVGAMASSIGRISAVAPVSQPNLCDGRPASATAYAGWAPTAPRGAAPASPSPGHPPAGKERREAAVSGRRQTNDGPTQRFAGASSHRGWMLLHSNRFASIRDQCNDDVDFRDHELISKYYEYSTQQSLAGVSSIPTHRLAERYRHRALAHFTHSLGVIVYLALHTASHARRALEVFHELSA